MIRYIVVMWFVSFNSVVFAQVRQEGVTVEHVLTAENYGKLQTLAARLMVKASKEQLQGYKQNTNNTIAFLAAWEEVRRTIRSKDPQFIEEDETTPIDRWALERFVGFVEGRLKVAPPEWWQNFVCRAEMDSITKQYLSFSAAEKLLLEPYFAPSDLDSFRYLRSLDIQKREDGGLDVTVEDSEVKAKELSCTISKEQISHISKSGILVDNTLTGFTAWMDTERCVFGFHDRGSSRFALHSLERKSGRLLWSTEVWGYSFYATSGNWFMNWAEIRVRDDNLYVFGIARGLIYIEGFSMKDGKNLFHFTSNYVDHDTRP